MENLADISEPQLTHFVLKDPSIQISICCRSFNEIFLLIDTWIKGIIWFEMISLRFRNIRQVFHKGC